MVWNKKAIQILVSQHNDFSQCKKLVNENEPASFLVDILEHMEEKFSWILKKWNLII